MIHAERHHHPYASCNSTELPLKEEGGTYPTTPREHTPHTGVLELYHTQERKAGAGANNFHQPVNTWSVERLCSEKVHALMVLFHHTLEV